ncbi:uncharacterized protein M6B38_255195 [Iris pallida]|uniref:Uncharacterized protein n=1 Tax=Iris pallida TaxID=29817 RepID=A0AAX6IGX6_IRIPA|nr:uncharacterized protein M6B38_255195 [Iris pallida]
MSRAGAAMSSDTILDSSASGDGDALKCDDDCQTTKSPRLRGDLDGHMMRLFPPPIRSSSLFAHVP